LIEGNQDDLAPFITAGLIDYIALYLPTFDPSSFGVTPDPATVFPAEFSLTTITRTGTFLRMDASRRDG
jgi:hypothetical protein